MYVYRHNNVCMSIDMVIENSELKSAWMLVLEIGLYSLIHSFND